MKRQRGELESSWQEPQPETIEAKKAALLAALSGGHDSPE